MVKISRVKPLGNVLEIDALSAYLINNFKGEVGNTAVYMGNTCVLYRNN
jgi:hypothetical protein